MTPGQLAAAGYAHRCLNGGRMAEWFKGLHPTMHALDIRNSRLLVRFGEWRDIPFIVYFQMPHSYYPLRHIQTVEQMEQLYQLLRTPEEA